MSLPNEGEYIPKAYQFERDLDTNPLDTRIDNLTFSKRANMVFRYTNVDSLATTEQGLTDLGRMIHIFFSEQVDRIHKLRSYTEGQNWTINHGRRRIEKYRSDYRISHAYGKYITNFITGYLLGNPVTITTQLKDSDDLEDIEAINRHNDVDSLNYSLALDQSRYGRAFELEYRTSDGKDRITQIETDEIFCIYSADVENQLIGAVHLPTYNGKIHPTLYIADWVYRFEPMKHSLDELIVDTRTVNFYHHVPVIEWWNGKYRLSDFEGVIPEIDALDAAQSDTANYMSDLNDAMLVIKGDVESADLTKAELMEMAKANTLILESGMNASGQQTTIDAEYIYKKFDSQGVESYKKRLVDTIFQLSNIPNLTDEKLGTQSGIAIKYKLIGLKQLGVTKTAYIKKALRERYNIIEKVHIELGDSEFNSEALDFTFHENIPEDVWDEVKSYKEAGGELSQQTLQELASFIDPRKEKERLNQEKQKQLSLNEQPQMIEVPNE